MNQVQTEITTTMEAKDEYKLLDVSPSYTDL